MYRNAMTKITYNNYKTSESKRRRLLTKRVIESIQYKQACSNGTVKKFSKFSKNVTKSSMSIKNTTFP